MVGFRGVTFQCASCRALVSARDVAVDATNERAALSCDACGARTWLPFAGSEGAPVVDVNVSTSSSSSSSSSASSTTSITGSSTGGAPLALPTVSGASTALVPLSASTAVGVTWSDEQRTRIAARLDKLAPQGDAQAELATSFTKLLATWSNEAEHKTLLTKASLVRELAFVGQRYRAVLEESPSDERAKKAQNDLLGLAMASMSRDQDFGGAAGDGAGTQKKLLAAGIVVVGVLICAAIVIFLPRLLDPTATYATEPPPVGEDVAEDVAEDGVATGQAGDGQNIAVPAPGR